MLPTNLNTNEVKESSGAEQEFSRFSQLGQTLIFKKVGEMPNAPHRLTISHKEIGDGASKRRRSLVRFDLTVDAGLDTATIEPKICSAYAVVDIPVGVLVDYSDVTNLVANLISFLATTGAGTTVLFDGSGHGASALINGSL